MSKKARSTPAKPCKCNKCGVEAHAIGGTLHRRCAGSAENPSLKAKSEKLPTGARGTWG